MKTLNIDVSKLKIAKSNIRTGELIGIEELASNIKDVGLIHPLVVRKVKNNYHVVAGQRRLSAINLINKDNIIFSEVACRVLESNKSNDETISLSENSFTQQMDYVERCEVYSLLVNKGKSIKAIAKSFGTSEHKVKQFISIGDLNPKFRDLYYSNVLDGDTLMFCTRFNADEQIKIIKAIDNNELHPNTWNIKNFMIKSNINPDYALFDLAESGLAISAELFSDDKYIVDIDGFWKMQNKAIDVKKEKLEDNGWAVKVFGPEDEFEWWNYPDGTKKEGATFILKLSSDGELKEYKKILKSNKSKDSSENTIKSPRQEITADAQKYYSDWHFQMSRNHLMNNKNDCFVWFVTNMLCGNGIGFECSNFEANPDDAQLNNSTITKSLNKLIKKYNNKYSFDSSWRNNPIEIYKTLVKLKQAELIDICNAVLLSSLADNTETIEYIGVKNNINPLEYWKADITTVNTFTSKDSTRSIADELIKDENELKQFEGKTIKARKLVLSENLSNGFIPAYMKYPVSKYGDVKLNIERYSDE